jgi:hypothetical protein
VTTKVIPLTAVSIQSANANKRFGQLAYMPLSSSPWGQVLLRGALTGIPAGATVQSAVLTMRSRNSPSWSGSRTVTAQALTGGFSTSTTWAGAPSATPTNQVSVSQTGAVFGAYWTLDVTAIAQAWVSGTLANNGLKVSSSSTTAGIFQGATAPWGAPFLTITYVTEAEPPTGLHPASGAVSVSKPTLTFQAPSDTISIQVQVDPAANGTSPGFDSGELAYAGGLLDLSATSYAGLSSGSSTQWRARVKNAFGWSDYSAWVTFSRTGWGTVAITSPGSTSEDPSPVITATYTGTVTSWRALLKNSLGAVIEDSGWTPGTTPAFGTTKSVGTSGTAVMQIRDDEVRDATPGDPDYVEVSKAFTVAPSGTPSVIASVAGSNDKVSPLVTLTGTRAAGVPDEVAIYRDGVLADRVPGASVFSGTTMTYLDKGAGMNTAHAYTVYAVVNGAWSNASAAVNVTPRCKGIWIFDADTGVGDAALILGDDDQEQTQPEVSVVHRPVSGPSGVPQVVRRRLSRYPREGAVAGTLVDALGVSAATSEANLRAWADYDAGHLYRLVLGNQNDLVILGDIDFDEVASNGPAERVVDVALNWWSQG